MTTHREVEVKVLEVETASLVARLEALGAKKIFEGVMKVVSFKGLPKGVSLLRVRQEGEQTYLAVKRQQIREGVRDVEEQSIIVDEFESTVRLLETIGFSVKRRYEKHRLSYRLRGVRFEFDTLYEEDIPTFLEIEGSSPEEVKEALSWLEIPDDRALAWTGKDVRRHYGKE